MHMAADEKTSGIHDPKGVTRVCREMAQWEESSSEAGKGTACLEGSRAECYHRLTRIPILASHPLFVLSNEFWRRTSPKKCIVSRTWAGKWLF
jgi:hypothetical protein